MNKSLLKITLLFAGGAFAMFPAYASTAPTIDFGGGANGAAGCLAIASNVLSSFSTCSSSAAVNIGTMTIQNAANASADGDWTINNGALNWNASTDTLTITGSIGSCTFECGGSTSYLSEGSTVTLLTMVLRSGIDLNGSSPNPGYTQPTGGTTITASYGTPTSITELSSLLSEMGYSSASSTVSGGITGSNGPTGPASSGNYTATSQTADLTLSNLVGVPEPASFLLFASGLLGAAWFVRRRSVKN